MKQEILQCFPEKPSINMNNRLGFVWDMDDGACSQDYEGEHQVKV